MYRAEITFTGKGLDKTVVLEADSPKGLRHELYKKSFEQLLDEDDRSQVQWEIANGVKKKKG